MKELYDITKTLAGKRRNLSKPVKDKEGRTINKEAEQSSIWEEHFKEIFNRDPPAERPDIPIAEMLLSVNTNPHSKSEISRDIKGRKDTRTRRHTTRGSESRPDNNNRYVAYILKNLGTRESPNRMEDGYLTKLPKKRDLGMCRNWRGITLLSVPSKVFTNIPLDRMKGALDETLREEQAGFRKNKSCTNHIATLRIIIEQSIEWQSPLYINFIDFEKAFDNVDRDVIWMLMHHYGIPAKFVTLIQQMYEHSDYQVIHNGKLSETSEVKTGVRQGCILLPFNFYHGDRLDSERDC